MTTTSSLCSTATATHRRFRRLTAILATLAAPAVLAMDLVRVETRTDEAVVEFGVSG